MKKRLLSLAVCLALCLTMVPPAALAEELVTQPTEPTETTAATESTETVETTESTESTEAAETTEATAAQETTPDTQPETVSQLRLVQDMIDALPKTVTAENRQDVIAMLEAIDQAKLALTDQERETLDFAKYEAAALALGEDHTPSLLERAETTVSTEADLRTALRGNAATIKLSEDITLTSDLEISRDVVLDLNEKTLSGTIVFKETVTVKNGKLKGSVTIGAGKTVTFSAIYISGSRSKVTVQDGAVWMGDGVACEGTVQLNGGTISSNISVYGQVTVSGKSTISGGSFEQGIQAEPDCTLTVSPDENFSPIFYGGIAGGCSVIGDIITLMNGETVHAQIERSALPKVDAPEKGKLFFIGWYTGEGGTGKEYTESDKNITKLYAKFLDANDVRTAEDFYALWRVGRSIKLGADIALDLTADENSYLPYVDLNGHTISGTLTTKRGVLLKNGIFQGKMEIIAGGVDLQNMTVNKSADEDKLIIGSSVYFYGINTTINVPVENNGTIEGGYDLVFSGQVLNNYKLSGGFYQGAVKNDSAQCMISKAIFASSGRIEGQKCKVHSAIFYGEEPDEELCAEDAHFVTFKNGDSVYAYGVCTDSYGLPELQPPTGSGEFLGWYTVDGFPWIFVSSQCSEDMNLTAKFGSSTVSTEEELRKAVDEHISPITLGASIALTGDLTLEMETTLNQGSYQLTSSGGTLILKEVLCTDGTDLHCRVKICTELENSHLVFRGPVEIAADFSAEYNDFYDAVTNAGYIRCGRFYGSVTNSGTIDNSDFYGPFTNTGTVVHSMFYKGKPENLSSDSILVTFKNGEDTYAVYVTELDKFYQTASVGEPDPPKMSGKIFLGWSNNGKDLYNFDGGCITQNTTLTAMWRDNSADTEESFWELLVYQLLHGLDMGSIKLTGDIELGDDYMEDYADLGEVLATQSVVIDLNGHHLTLKDGRSLIIGGTSSTKGLSAATDSEAGSASGLTILDSAGGGSISGLIIKENGTLYANGGTVTGAVVNDGTITASGGPTGYTTFTGKVTGSGDFLSGIYMGAAPGDAQTRTTLGPHIDFYWEGILYAVEIVGTNQVTVAPKTPQAPTGATPGYKFKSWEYTFGNKLTKTTTLGANLSPITYTIQLDEDGDGTAETTKTLKYNEEYILPAPSTTKKDHTFLGWKLGTTTYPAQKKVKNLTTTDGDALKLTGVWEKIVSIAIPWSLTVKQSGTAAPGKTTFDLNILAFDNDLSSDPLFALTWASELTTNGKGTYPGTLVLSGAQSNLNRVIGGGFYVTQNTGTASGWTYDKTVYYVNLTQGNDGIKVSVYPVKTEKKDDGTPVYTPDTTATTTLSFTNTYTKAAGKSDTTNPKTGDTIYFAQGTMLLSLAALVLLTKKRFARS